MPPKHTTRMEDYVGPRLSKEEKRLLQQLGAAADNSASSSDEEEAEEEAVEKTSLKEMKDDYRYHFSANGFDKGNGFEGLGGDHFIQPPHHTKAKPNTPTSVDVDFVDNDLIERIQSAIDYTEPLRKRGLPLDATTRFTLLTENSFPALDMLQQAHADGIATQIYAAHDKECYELGVSVPPPPLNTIDPSWWHGKAPGEIKAGPLATEEEIKKANATLKGAETKRRNDQEKGVVTKAQITINTKLTEALRRQETRKWLVHGGEEEDAVASSHFKVPAGPTAQRKRAGKHPNQARISNVFNQKLQSVNRSVTGPTAHSKQHDDSQGRRLSDWEISDDKEHDESVDHPAFAEDSSIEEGSVNVPVITPLASWQGGFDHDSSDGEWLPKKGA